MATLQSIGALLTSLLFGMVGFYLTLIAKFYRQKFSKGPPHRYLQISLAVLIAGLLLRVPFFQFVPALVAYGLISLGGIFFTALGYSLYRSMMSVE